jgi:streptogrisin D
MSSRRQHSVRVLGVGAIVAAVLTVGSVPANGSGATADTGTSPAMTSDEARDRVAAQAPLSAAAGDVQDVVDRGHDAGYAGIGLEDDGVVVWWKGTPPAAVRRAIREARRDVDVRVVGAAHTRAELESAAQELTDHIAAHPEQGYHGVEVAYDGSGLVLDATPSASRRSAANGLPAEVERATDVPASVPVRVQEKDPLELTGRLNDTAPFYGGARINNNDNTAFCTAGWPVRIGSTEYMLTAGHCGRTGGSWNNGNDTQFIGTGTHEHVAHDLLLVQTNVANRMWDGPIGTGEFTKRLVGSDHTFPGEWVCASGSVSGARCNYVVTSTFAFSVDGALDVYGNAETWNDLVLADYCCGAAGIPGDSGGPVFGLSGPDVVAKGTITGFWGGGSQLIFQDFITAQNDFGIVPVT